MGNQWETFTFASPAKMLGDVSPQPPIIAAPDTVRRAVRLRYQSFLSIEL